LLVFFATFLFWALLLALCLICSLPLAAVSRLAAAWNPTSCALAKFAASTGSYLEDRARSTGV
jgi:hypothetical protein